MGTVQGSLMKLVVDTLAGQSVHQSLKAGIFTGTALISEDVALKGSNAYRDLVATDRRRSEYAEAHPDERWVKTTILAGLQAGFGAAGLALGFPGSVEVSSLATDDRPYLKALANQARHLMVPLNAEGLLKLNAAPGSEWSIRGQGGKTLGVGIAPADLNSLGSFGATAGASVSGGFQTVYTKNVKMLEDNKVFVLIGRHTDETPSFAASAGASLKTLNIADGANTLVNRLGNGVERKTTAEATVSGSIAWPHREIAGAVLDLNNPADRTHYDYVMRASPLDAESYMKANHLGAKYVGEGREIKTGINLRFGSAKLLSTTTYRGKENGTLEKDGVLYTPGEASYQRSLEGLLPRFAKGEERVVTVRAGALTKNGVGNSALSVRMTVNDPNVFAEDLAQAQRFALAMGASTAGLPDPASSAAFGRGESTVEVAATDAQVLSLADKSADQVRLAFASALRDIEGAAVLPTWYENKPLFDSYRKQLRMANPSNKGADRTSSLLTAYAKQTGGRDLRRDIDSAEAVEHVIETAEKARGKPVQEWGHVLAAVGSQSSGDVRAGLLALHRLAGAQIVELSTTVAGHNSSTVNGHPGKSMIDLVGTVMLPE
jgi:hypothetical protein